MIEPLEQGQAVTPSDATLYRPRGKAFLVTGAGNVVVQFNDRDTTSVTIPVNANTLYHIRFSRIMAATTATGVIGFF